MNKYHVSIQFLVCKHELCQLVDWSRTFAAESDEQAHRQAWQLIRLRQQALLRDHDTASTSSFRLDSVPH